MSRAEKHRKISDARVRNSCANSNFGVSKSEIGNGSENEMLEDLSEIGKTRKLLEMLKMKIGVDPFVEILQVSSFTELRSVEVFGVRQWRQWGVVRGE